ncbi:MAG: GNAT family N-acetyltransferase [Ignavibacteriaceae bacterium]
MIRKYKIEYTEEILYIWQQASIIAHPFFTLEFINQEKKNIKEIYLPKSETFVYEENKIIQGFISMLDNEVGGLFVRPEKQRQGIGKKLLDYVSQFNKELDVEVFEANIAGMSFYKKYGFKKIKEYIHQETNHKIVIMKSIRGNRKIS